MARAGIGERCTRGLPGTMGMPTPPLLLLVLPEERRVRRSDGMRVGKPSMFMAASCGWVAFAGTAVAV